MQVGPQLFEDIVLQLVAAARNRPSSEFFAPKH